MSNKWTPSDEAAFNARPEVAAYGPTKEREPECLADMVKIADERMEAVFEKARVQRLGKRYTGMRKVLEANKPLGISDYIAAQAFMIQMEILAELEQTNAILRAVYFTDDGPPEKK